MHAIANTVNPKVQMAFTLKFILIETLKLKKTIVKKDRNKNSKKLVSWLKLNFLIPISMHADGENHGYLKRIDCLIQQHF